MLLISQCVSTEVPNSWKTTNISGIQVEHLSVNVIWIPTQMPQTAKSSPKQQTGRLLKCLVTDARKASSSSSSPVTPQCCRAAYQKPNHPCRGFMPITGHGLILPHPNRKAQETCLHHRHPSAHTRYNSDSSQAFDHADKPRLLPWHSQLKSSLQDYAKDLTTGQRFNLVSQFSPIGTAMFPVLTALMHLLGWELNSRWHLREQPANNIVAAQFVCRVQQEWGHSSYSQALTLVTSSIKISHMYTHPTKCTRLWVRR